MKRLISAKTAYEYDMDSISQILLDMDNIIKRLYAQKSNASTDEQEMKITEAVNYLRKAYNKLR